MKCPHCGIEIRDTMTVCMYCGGKIPQRKGTPPPPSGKAPEIGARGALKSPAGAKRSAGMEDAEGEEEGGGLAAFLQPGEQVLIGSLNVSVKKFFFHAYLTNKRIFLIDTQEKKLKVTAKDVPLSSISGSTVEFSENSDPVLVLSIRSADDEIKTMKLVFPGNGLDRSAEIDEWIELLNDQIQPKKPKKTPEQKRPGPESREPGEEGDEPGEEGGEEAPAHVREPQVSRQEARPAKRPVKDHEKQPPVKRLLPVYQAPPDEEMEDLPPQARRAQLVTDGDKDARAHLQPTTVREIPPSREHAVRQVKKVEVQSAMKTALKTGASQSHPSAERSPGSPVAAKKPFHVRTEPLVAQAPEEEEVTAYDGSGTEDEEEAAGPVFCQNCGKKLPAAANFCPGCGVRITATHEKPVLKNPPKSVRKPEEPAPVQNEQKAGEIRPQIKPPVKKVPKGSEMTILHKFLRR